MQEHDLHSAVHAVGKGSKFCVAPNETSGSHRDGCRHTTSIDPPLRGGQALGRSSQSKVITDHDFAGTNESSSATLVRCETEMLRGLDCVHRIPSRSQYSQNRPRMSSERFEKNQRG
jgi:hypothetical protein